MQILVMGMHRSGTSMVTRLINLMGAYFGSEAIATKPNDENPKGFWERRDIRKLNDELLFAQDCDWNRVLHYQPEVVDADTQERFIEKATKLLQELDAHDSWVAKEPRLCVTLPLWLPLLRTPVAVIVLRDPLEIASSLKQRNGIPLTAGVALAHYYYRNVILSTHHLDKILVQHRHLISDPVGAVRQLAIRLKELGASTLQAPSDSQVLEFVDARLHRNQVHAAESKAQLTPTQEQFFAALARADWASAWRSAQTPLGVDRETLELYEHAVTQQRRAHQAEAEARRSEKTRADYERRLKRATTAATQLQAALDQMAGEKAAETALRAALDEQLAQRTKHYEKVLAESAAREEDLLRQLSNLQCATLDKHQRVRALIGDANKLLARMDKSAQAIEQSSSWRFGNLVVRSLRSLSGRSRGGTVFRQMSEQSLNARNKLDVAVAYLSQSLDV